jgi:hypothetical protein
MANGWSWGECELVTDCIKWGTAGFWWKDAKLWWSQCSGSIPSECLTWGTAGEWWKHAAWMWKECSGSFQPPIPPFTASLQPVGVDAMTLQQPWLEEPWSPYRPNDSGSLAKRKRLIKLICKVRGQKYDEEKEYRRFEVSADDIRLIVKKVSGIDLDLKLEE